MSHITIKSDKVILACKRAILKYKQMDKQACIENMGTISQYKLHNQEISMLCELKSLCSITKVVHLSTRDFKLLKRHFKNIDIIKED